MKKSLLVLLLAPVFLLALVGVSYSQYVTIQIPKSMGPSFNVHFPPQINDKGQVVWAEEYYFGFDPFYSDYIGVSLYSAYLGSTNLVWDVTCSGACPNYYDSLYPQINNNGELAWSFGGIPNIYIYEKTFSGSGPWAVTELLRNSYSDFLPEINDSGEVVWYGGSSTSTADREIYLRKWSGTISITSNSYEDSFPQINNDGEVVWQGSDGSDNEIYFYDGSGITQITNNSYDDWFPQINASGEVVWYGSDGSDNEIYLYNGSVITQVTDNAYDDVSPRISDSGEVVWTADDGSDEEVYLYDGSGITPLTNNSYDDHSPQINNNGEVVWSGNDGSDLEIYLYDGSGITPLTNNSYDDHSPQINNNGDLVWVADAIDNDTIFFACTCVDIDGDGYCSPPCPAWENPKPDCDDSNPDINPGAIEIPGNGIDEDCRSDTPPPWDAASTVMAEYQDSSDIANYLFLLIVPIGAVIAMRIIRRKK